MCPLRDHEPGERVLSSTFDGGAFVSFVSRTLVELSFPPFQDRVLFGLA